MVRYCKNPDAVCFRCVSGEKTPFLFVILQSFGIHYTEILPPPASWKYITKLLILEKGVDFFRKRAKIYISTRNERVLIFHIIFLGGILYDD